MTREETQQILSVLRINYPNSFTRLSADETFMYLDLWAEAFRDDDVKIVIAAVKAIIYGDKKEFAPNIGQVKNKMYELMNQDEMTEYEAWGLVKKALRNSGYHAREEFDKLPPVIQRLVGEPRQLYDWSMMDTSQVDTVVASNFMRSYKVRAKHEKEYLLIPDSIKETLGIEHLAEQFKPKQISTNVQIDSITLLEQQYEAELLSLGLSSKNLEELREYADQHVFAYKDVLAIILKDMRDGKKREVVLREIRKALKIGAL